MPFAVDHARDDERGAEPFALVTAQHGYPASDADWHLPSAQEPLLPFAPCPCLQVVFLCIQTRIFGWTASPYFATTRPPTTGVRKVGEGVKLQYTPNSPYGSRNIPLTLYGACSSDR